MQTFIGVAPMKIKWLYRKLRKLALRYGGVVVFFDEADVLGNRGSSASGGQFDTRREQDAAAALHTCNGAHYVDDQALSIIWHGLSGPSSTASARIDGEDQKPKKRGIIMGGMGMGGGGMGALQALLTEMSGLKKPRGFFSRRMRSFLCIKPKPPPKYRILHIMATNRPDVARRRAAAARPPRPHLQGRLPARGRPAAHVRGLPRQGQARADRAPDRAGWPSSRRTPPAPSSRTSSTRR